MCVLGWGGGGGGDVLSVRQGERAELMGPLGKVKCFSKEAETVRSRSVKVEV